MTYFVKLLMVSGTLALGVSAAACSENIEDMAPSFSTPGDLLLGMWKGEGGDAQILCKDGTTGLMTTTMIRGGQFDVKTGWQSGNPYGGVTFALTAMGRQRIDIEDVSINPHPDELDYLTCGDGTNSDPWQFSDVAAIEAILIPDKAKYLVYAYRNQQVMDSFLAGKQHFSMDMGDMSACRQEVVVQLEVPSSGSLEIDVNLRIGRSIGEEDAPNVNDELYAETLDDVIIVRTERGISSVAAFLADAANTSANVSTDRIEVIRFAKTMTCLQPGDQWRTIRPTVTGINKPNITCSQAEFGCPLHVSVSESQMSGCTRLFWDPKITPSTRWGMDADADFAQSVAGPTSVLVFAGSVAWGLLAGQQA